MICGRAAQSVGRLSGGRPLGIGPTTWTPSAPRSSAYVTAVAASTASSGQGRVGASRVPTNRVTTTPTPIARVGQWIWPVARIAARICPIGCELSTSMPMTRPSCPATMMTATPARYPLSTGRLSSSAMKPSRSSPASRASPPTTRAHRVAIAAYCAGSPRASGASAAAVRIAVVDSGPTLSIRDVPTTAYRVRGSRQAHSPATGSSPASVA